MIKLEAGCEYDSPLTLQPGEYIYREDILGSGVRRIIICSRHNVSAASKYVIKPRAKCPDCPRDVAVSVDGRLHIHGSLNNRCPGSRKEPAPWR